MIVIYGEDFLIKIPDYEEYCIYHTDYECDKHGNIVREAGRTDTYDMGDLIIQTPFCKYTLKKIYFCFWHYQKLAKYIFKQEKKQESCILVDLKKVVSEEVASCEMKVEVFEEKMLIPEKHVAKEERIRNICFNSKDASLPKNKLLDEFIRNMEKEYGEA